jgi:hypothetical protein
MKAPLLLGNDVRIMDKVALGVVTNKDALAISQVGRRHSFIG